MGGYIELVHTGHSRSSWTLLAGAPAAFRVTVVNVLFDTAPESVSDSVLEGVSPSRTGDSGISIFTFDGAIPILPYLPPDNVHKIPSELYPTIPDSPAPTFTASASPQAAVHNIQLEQFPLTNQLDPTRTQSNVTIHPPSPTIDLSQSKQSITTR